MKLAQRQILHGPNIHHRRSVLVAVLDLEGAEPPLAALLQARMARRLPAGAAWNPVRTTIAAALKRQPAGDWFDIVGALAVTLQEERYPTEWRWWRPAAGPGLLVEFDDAEVARRALGLAVEIAHALAAADDAAADLPATLAMPMDAFVRGRSGIRFNWITALLAEAARTRGVPVAKLLPGQPIAVFGQGRHRRRMLECFGDGTSALAARLSQDKRVTLALLEASFVPVPRQRVLRHRDGLDEAVRAIGFPLVVKGRTSDHGASVTTGITTFEELERAIRRVEALNDTVLIEQHVEGDDFRFTVVDGRVAAVARRVPPAVTGDGRRTVRELVAAENERRRRSGRYAGWIRPLALDAEADAMLARVGLTADAVPPAGDTVRLRGAANLSQGGLAVDVTDDVHPDVVATVEQAVAALGLDLAGVDLLTTDIGRPLRQTGGVIIEINNLPGLRPHYVTPTPPRDVAGAVIDYLFPAPARGRIPTVMVTGTNGKTTTARMVARLLEGQGLTVGLSTTAGVSIGGRAIVRGDWAGGLPAAVILRDPRVDAGVFEMARGAIVRHGLRLQDCDVGVVTNVTDDHVGQDGMADLASIARAKRLVVEVARRAVVLNADDAHCRDMAAHAAAPVWWISATGEAALPAGHLAAGGDALVVDRRDGAEIIVHRHGATALPVMAVSDIPATLGGAARHNLENALCAAAAGLALGLTIASVRQALSGFDNSHVVSPGRLNIVDTGGVRIVFDYVHNLDGLRRIGAVLATMQQPGQRRFVMCRTGTRAEADYAAYAALAATLFDEFFVAPIGDPRAGRAPGDIVRLLVEGLHAAGVPPSKVHAAGTVAAALDAVLPRLRAGDLLLVGGDDSEAVWRRLQRFRPAAS